MNQLGDALEAAGFTPDDVTKLKQFSGLPQIKDVIYGRAKIVPITEGISESILRRIFDKPLIIGSTDGTKTIPDSADLFAAGVDGDFRNWRADEPGAPTGETPVHVYEMVRDATFAQMFSSLSPDLGKLCLTHDQILTFIETHRDQLRTDGYATFFLFKSHDQFFVACVRVNSRSRLYVIVRRFEYSRVWSAEYSYRLVVPQLA
jgi:hypothetical protein